MSLLNLVHKSVIIKFSDSTGQFKPEASYVFRLSGVDGMGFLQIQDLRPSADGGHEVASEPYWVNKDLIREIHELDLAKHKGSLVHTGTAKKLTPPPKPEKAPKTKAKSAAL
jgi:hypothetical protein